MSYESIYGDEYDCDFDGFPGLIDLPVVRETYCSQTMTDGLLEYLWDSEDQYVAAFADMEANNKRDLYLARRCYNVGGHIRELPSGNVSVPDSRLGLIDFIYELSRRLRLWFELDEINVGGTELEFTPDGRLPPPVELPDEYGDSPWTLPFEEADSICREAWNRDPQLIYEISEAMRRQVTTHEIDNALWELLEAVNAPQRDIRELADVKGLLWQRIRLMSHLPVW